MPKALFGVWHDESRRFTVEQADLRAFCADIVSGPWPINRGTFTAAVRAKFGHLWPNMNNETFEFHARTIFEYADLIRGPGWEPLIEWLEGELTNA